MIAAMAQLVKAVIVCLALCAVGATSAQAAFPGRNGKLVFDEYYQYENYDIYSIEPNGTGLTRLTDHPALDMEAAWSPDGRHIAFTSSRDSAEPTCMNQGYNCDLDVYTMDADGSDVKRLTDHPGRDGEPAWSPDGKRIVFTSLRDGELTFGSDAFNSELYVMNANGRQETRITTFPYVDKHPAWSPDGTRIAFFRGNCAYNCTSHIFTVDPSGNGLVALTAGANARDRLPDWSPDGSRIVFNREGQFWFMNADGSSKSTLLAPRQEPVWSPDGTRIGHGYPGIGHHNLDGSSPVLTFNSGNLPDWQPLGPRPEDFADRAAFCEAERAFLGREDFRSEYGNFRKCVRGAA